MTHTPAPWKYEQKGTNKSSVIYTMEKIDGIANVYPCDEVEANARLISAAPELLEALINAVARMEENKPAPGDDMHKVFKRAVFYRDLEEARRAIAKATS